jgi:hypothetical protein
MITSCQTVSYRDETAGISAAVENGYFLPNPPVNISIPRDFRGAETPPLFHPFAVSHISNPGLLYKLSGVRKQVVIPGIKVGNIVHIMTGRYTGCFRSRIALFYVSAFQFLLTY